MVTQGEIEAESGKSVDAALFNAEMMNVPLETIRALAETAGETKAAIAALAEGMNAKMQDAAVISLSTLEKEVTRLFKYYNNHLQTYGGAAAEGDGAEASVDEAAAPAPRAGGGGGAFNLAAYQATGRAEALLLLRKGAEYFQKQEPNSPIPLLVGRALRVSEMSFLDLVADMMPDALSRGRDILGVKVE
jgi:type VI secretion system protein ImpA